MYDSFSNLPKLLVRFPVTSKLILSSLLLGLLSTLITTVAGICETDKPSSTPPAMPATPRKGTAEFQCPAGSHLLVR